MLREKAGNIIFLVIITTFAALYYFDTMRLSRLEERLVVMALFFLMLAAVAINIAQLYFETVREKKDAGTAVEDQKHEEEEGMFSKKKLLFITGAILYLLFLNIIGFFLSSFLFFVAISWLLGNRKILSLLAVPTATLIVIYVSFSHFLNINLPRGMFL